MEASQKEFEYRGTISTFFWIILLTSLTAFYFLICIQQTKLRVLTFVGDEFDLFIENSKPA